MCVLFVFGQLTRILLILQFLWFWPHLFLMKNEYNQASVLAYKQIGRVRVYAYTINYFFTDVAFLLFALVIQENHHLIVPLW